MVGGLVRGWHLYATDVTGFELMRDYVATDLEQALEGVVVPFNRLMTEKVRTLIRVAEESGVPWGCHRRDAGVPPEVGRAEAALSWAYTQILQPSELAQYPQGVLNFHGGALPEYAGAHALQRAMANHEPTIGCVWHVMVEAVDAGPVLAQSVIPTVEPFAVMRQRVFAEGRRLWPEAVRVWDQRTRGGVHAGATERHRGRVS